MEAHITRPLNSTFVIALHLTPVGSSFTNYTVVTRAIIPSDAAFSFRYALNMNCQKSLSDEPFQ